MWAPVDIVSYGKSRVWNSVAVGRKRLELLEKLVPHANLPKREERGTEARTLSSATAPSRQKGKLICAWYSWVLTALDKSPQSRLKHVLTLPNPRKLLSEDEWDFRLQTSWWMFTRWSWSATASSTSAWAWAEAIGDSADEQDCLSFGIFGTCTSTLRVIRTFTSIIDEFSVTLMLIKGFDAEQVDNRRKRIDKIGLWEGDFWTDETRAFGSFRLWFT